MDIKAISKTVARGVSKNLPTIMTATGVCGMIFTVGLAIKIAPKAERVYSQKMAEKPDMKFTEKAKIIGKLYWPVALSGIATGACILSANSINLKRNAAAIAAYQVSEAALESFKEATVKTVGEKKEQDIEYKVAEEQLKQNPVSQNTIIMTNGGDQLCYDSISGRYFRSTRDKIQRAVNKINQTLMNENTVSLNEFYDLLELEHIDLGDMLGWNMQTMDDLFEVSFTSHLTENGEPALVIRYDIAPTYDFYDF